MKLITIFFWETFQFNFTKKNIVLIFFSYSAGPKFKMVILVVVLEGWRCWRSHFWCGNFEFRIPGLQHLAENIYLNLKLKILPKTEWKRNKKLQAFKTSLQLSSKCYSKFPPFVSSLPTSADDVKIVKISCPNFDLFKNFRMGPKYCLSWWLILQVH